jgi:triosephosphate isomerase
MESIIMYGGSVNLSNIKSISNIDGVDGMLIGSASIDPNNLLNMIKEIEM